MVFRATMDRFDQGPVFVPPVRPSTGGHRLYGLEIIEARIRWLWARRRFIRWFSVHGKPGRGCRILRDADKGGHIRRGADDCTSGVASRDDGRRGADCRAGEETRRHNWPVAAVRGGDLAWPRGWFRAFGSSLQRRRTAKATSEIISVYISIIPKQSFSAIRPSRWIIFTATNQPFFFCVRQAISSYGWLCLTCISYMF